MIKAYFLPGMAADERLYHKLTVEGVDPVFIRWPEPGNAQTLRDYAERIIEHYIQPDEPHLLVGSSMGGMVAVELSHLTRPKHTFLLSAPSTRREFPTLLNRVRASRVHRILGPKTTFKVNRLADVFMGFKQEEDRQLFYEMLDGYGPEFLHFAIRAVLEWDQQTPPAAFTQIIGSEDKLFPPKRMEREPLVIQGGGHFTTFEYPHELSALLNARFSAFST